MRSASTGLTPASTGLFLQPSCALASEHKERPNGARLRRTEHSSYDKESTSCSQYGCGKSAKVSKPRQFQDKLQGCLIQVGNGIELEAVCLQFEPYRWRPCGVTWDSS